MFVKIRFFRKNQIMESKKRHIRKNEKMERKKTRIISLWAATQLATATTHGCAVQTLRRRGRPTGAHSSSSAILHAAPECEVA
jgi:hypothetical protein